MGINNLLPFLKSITEKSHIEKYKNEVVGVDIMCWIHRSLISCAYDIVTGKENDRYLKFIIKMLDLLKYHEVKVVVVFDGEELPAKKMENELRRNRRNNAKEEVLQLIKKVKEPKESVEVMKKCLQALSVSKEIILSVINLCKERQIEYIIAPYEADAQLAYLCRMGYISAVISEDSDLLVYGCPRVLYKLKDDGNCFEIKIIPMDDLITLDQIVQIKNPLSESNNEIYITPLKNMKKENQITKDTLSKMRTKENNATNSKKHIKEQTTFFNEMKNQRRRRNGSDSLCENKMESTSKKKRTNCVLKDKGEFFTYEKKEKEHNTENRESTTPLENKQEFYQLVMNNYIKKFKWPSDIYNLKYFNLYMFITMCILSGCDYSNDFHIRGMGIQKAFKLMHEFKNVEQLFIFLTKDEKWKWKLPKELDSFKKLIKKYKEIESAFLQHPVYDIATQKILPIQDSFQSVVLKKRENPSFIQEIIERSNEDVHKSLESMKQYMERITKQRFVLIKENENKENEETNQAELFEKTSLGNVSPGTLEFLEISSCEKKQKQEQQTQEPIYKPSKMIYESEKCVCKMEEEYTQNLTTKRTIQNNPKTIILEGCYGDEVIKHENRENSKIHNDQVNKEKESVSSGNIFSGFFKKKDETSMKYSVDSLEKEKWNGEPSHQVQTNKIHSFDEEEINSTPLRFSFDAEKFFNLGKRNEENSVSESEDNQSTNRNERSMHNHHSTNVKVERTEDQEPTTKQNYLTEHITHKIETRSIKDSYKNVSRNYSFIKQDDSIHDTKKLTTKIINNENSSLLPTVDKKENELIHTRNRTFMVDDKNTDPYRKYDRSIKNEIKNEQNLEKLNSKFPIMSPCKNAKQVSQNVQQMKITNFFKKTNKNKKNDNENENNTTPKLNKMIHTEFYSSGGSTQKVNSFAKTRQMSIQKVTCENIDLPNLYEDALEDSSQRKQHPYFTPLKRKYQETKNNNNRYSKKRLISKNVRRDIMDIRSFGHTPKKEINLSESVGLDSFENLLSLSNDKYVKENLSNSYNCRYSKEYEERNGEKNYDGTSPLKKELKEIIDSVKLKHSLRNNRHYEQEGTSYENYLKEKKNEIKQIEKDSVSNIHYRSIYVNKNSETLKMKEDQIKTNIQRKEHTTNENKSNENWKSKNKSIEEQKIQNTELCKQKEYPKRSFISKNTKLNPFDYFKELKDPIFKNPYLEK